MTRHTTALRRRGDSADGFTSVELLVVMGIMLAVSVVVLSSLVAGLRATARGQARVEALTDLERAAERMARDLRFADPIDAATNTQVIVNVLRDESGNPVRHRVTYDVGAGTIAETRAVYDPPDAAVPTSTATTTVIGDLDPGATVFSFAKADGQAWIAGTDALTDLAEIRLDLRRQLPDQNPMELETSVFVRNVDDGR